MYLYVIISWLVSFVNFITQKSLEAIIFGQIPNTHRLMRLKRKVNFEQVDKLCASYYTQSQSGMGAKAIPPNKLFKMLILMVLYSIPSQRMLIEHIKFNYLFRYFCGFGCFDKIPDHSSLTRFRQRLGVEGFEKLFVWVLEQCIDAGLVKNESVYFDNSSMEAASTHLSSREQAVRLYQLAIRLLFAHEAEEAEEAEEAGEAEEMVDQQTRHQVAKEVASLLKYQSTTKPEDSATRILEMAKKYPSPIALEKEALTPQMLKLSQAQAQAQKVLRSRTSLRDFLTFVLSLMPHAKRDKECQFGTLTRRFLGYLIGMMVDGAHLVITSCVLHPANASPAETFIEGYHKHRKVVGIPKEFTADSAFDREPEVRKSLEDDKVKVNIPLRESRALGKLSIDLFQYNATGDFICPAGYAMRSLKPTADGNGRLRLSYEGTHCFDCELKELCTSSKSKKRVVQFDKERHQKRKEIKVKNESQEYKKRMLERMQIEGIFGFGKGHAHLGKAHYFDIQSNLQYALLFATVFNMLILLRDG